LEAVMVRSVTGDATMLPVVKIGMLAVAEQSI
jgi:hypothetical protein